MVDRDHSLLISLTHLESYDARGIQFLAVIIERVIDGIEVNSEKMIRRPYGQVVHRE